MGKDEAKGGGADLIKDSDTKSFMTDVIEASRDVPIIVDFWAPWCEPCKQLGPLLEKVVKAAGGAVRMVKINIDENQALAQQLRIQSIPMVYAFKNGQPADGFQGALPESQIKAFIERLTGPIGPAPTEIGIEQAKEALTFHGISTKCPWSSSIFSVFRGVSVEITVHMHIGNWRFSYDFSTS